MKELIIVISLLFSAGICLADKAAGDFFPASTGFSWIYKTTPLDSNNIALTELTNYKLDSFAVDNISFMNKTAKLILSRQNNLNAIADSMYLSFSGNDAWSYLSPFSVQDWQDSLGIISILQNAAGWYDVYRFGSSTNASYAIFSKDTTIAIDSIFLPLRLEVKGKRLSDQTINTDLGNFSCKRFVLTGSVGYLVLPQLAIPLVEIPDTVYISSGRWIVRQARASKKIDLSQLAELAGSAVSIPKFYIYGREVEVTDSIPAENNIYSGYEKKSEIYATNYPNPFNSTTEILFSIPDTKQLKLTVFDVSGRVIYNKNISHLSAGKHSVNLDMSDFSGGVYFYKISADNKLLSGKLLFLK